MHSLLYKNFYIAQGAKFFWLLLDFKINVRLQEKIYLKLT
jgi:hypothetical protein